MVKYVNWITWRIGSEAADYAKKMLYHIIKVTKEDIKAACVNVRTIFTRPNYLHSIFFSEFSQVSN